MRDIFSEMFENQPLDPMEAARRNVRPVLRKRFYRQAHVGEAEGRFALLVDEKPVKTPARRALAAPARALADELAAEWNAQAELIDPARMPLTRLANAVIDAVAEAMQPVAEEVAKYLATDLLCYRAERPEGLIERQALAWDPVLTWAREDIGARFVLAEGVMHVAQAAEVIAAMRAIIPDEPWRLGAVSAITTLTGSALLALALDQAALTAEAAWAAAHIDEDWQMQQWGRDEMALERRAYRRAEFDAAATVLRLT
jgi:chaperone required for assembly of F1-ATPase